MPDSKKRQAYLWRLAFHQLTLRSWWGKPTSDPRDASQASPDQRQ